MALENYRHLSNLCLDVVSQKKKEKIEKKKTTLCVSSVTVLLHGTTLDLGAPFNGGARGWFLSSPGTGTVWGPGGSQQPQTPWKVSLVRCGVSGSGPTSRTPLCGLALSSQEPPVWGFGEYCGDGKRKE